MNLEYREVWLSELVVVELVRRVSSFSFFSPSSFISLIFFITLGVYPLFVHSHCLSRREHMNNETNEVFTFFSIEISFELDCKLRELRRILNVIQVSEMLLVDVIN